MSWSDRMDDYYRQKWQAEQPQRAPDPEDTREWLHSFGPAVLVPGAQAIVSGVFVGVAAGVLAKLAGADPWSWGFGAWASLQAVTWCGLLWRWADLTQPLERLINADLNGDGRIGPDPSLPPPKVRIELVAPDRHQTSIIELPTPQEKLVLLAAGLLAGQSFSEREWTGSGRPYSTNQFRELRDAMLKRGLLAPSNPKAPQQGYSLTPGGNAAMRYFASLSAAPSPTLTARAGENE